MAGKITLQPHQLKKFLTRFTQKELADILEVNERTIRRKINPSNKPKQKQGRKRKFNQFVLKYLCSFTITLQITQKLLAQTFSCSQSTISLSLKRAGVSYKKISYQSSEQLGQRNKAKIKEFINETIPSLLQTNSNIFFLDESSFHLNVAPRRGYYWKSSRLVRQKPGDKGKNQSLILLTQITSGEKIIHSRLIEGGVNSKVFHEFLTDFHPPNNGKRNCLIMDNLPTHKATKSCQKLGLTTIKELMDSKNTRIIFTPPYTPELNPTEPMLNIIRQHVEKSQARIKGRLSSVIEEKLSFFQKEDTTKYLESSIKECLMKNNDICQEQFWRKIEVSVYTYIKHKVYDMKSDNSIKWLTRAEINRLKL